MPEIRDFMSTDLLTVDPETSLREAADLLATEHIGGVPVVAGEDTVGVLSIHDVLSFESSLPGAPSASEPSPEWQGADESRETWPEEDAENAPLYFTDMWTDAGGDVVERFGETDRPEWNVLDEHTVSEAMTPAVHALPPDTGVVEAARYLLDHDIHRVLVVQDGALLGVFTGTDVVRAVAEDRLDD